ncbi:MAG TPA: PQQ-dependent sugar dehydrogenase [Candidatus Acidoferrum sp.]|nr:PQQ-dependent sugar dehydrogenase [Candidatus Acidoferrum sp.]
MWSRLGLAVLASWLIAVPAFGQAQKFVLGAGPWLFDTYSPNGKIKVSVVTKGINKAFGLAFLPNGDLLVAESVGRLRVIRGGKLDPTAVEGTPVIAKGANAGLMDIVLHPDFAHNRLVYFTYVKPGKSPSTAKADEYYATTALGRGKLNEAETALTDVKDLFVADAWSNVRGGHGSRIRFAPDGTLFFSSPFRRDFVRPQLMDNDISKLLRLNDDGSIPADNPFVGKPGNKPEIWSIGHRAIEGIAWNPVTHELWASEHGPQGGDEVNIIHKGANYGWPVVSFGRDYEGPWVSPTPVAPGMTLPEIIWVPSIATTGLMFYTGDKFPKWKNNMFAGGMMKGRIPGTGHIERIEFNEHGEQKRESLLEDLHQRIRDVQQGPDGLIYALTDEEDGALLKIEPAQ